MASETFEKERMKSARNYAELLSRPPLSGDFLVVSPSHLLVVHDIILTG